MRLTTKFYLVLSFFLLTACGGSSTTSINPEPDPNTNNPPSSENITWYRPTPSTTWQWQLQGLITTSYEVALYDIDLFDSTTVLIEFLQSNNRKVICYFSAGSYESFRSDSDQFELADLGKTLDGFEDERWLDIRSRNVRNIMKNRLELARQKGCDGVEPDNVDGYANDSGFTLSPSDQLDFNRFIAAEAHARGLSVGLKNDLDQITELVDNFDFAVNEQCFEFNECELLTPFITQGKAVLNTEYKQEYVSDSDLRDSLCNDSIALQFSSLIMPLDLDDSFRFSCL